MQNAITVRFVYKRYTKANENSVKGKLKFKKFNNTNYSKVILAKKLKKKTMITKDEYLLEINKLILNFSKKINTEFLECSE